MTGNSREWFGVLCSLAPEREPKREAVPPQEPADALPWLEPRQGWRAPEQMLNWLIYRPRSFSHNRAVGEAPVPEDEASR
jgi:hypothetical protein